MTEPSLGACCDKTLDQPDGKQRCLARIYFFCFYSKNLHQKKLTLMKDIFYKTCATSGRCGEESLCIHLIKSASRPF